MGRLIRSWNRLSVGLLSVALVLVACSNPVGVSDKDGVAASQGEPAAVVDIGELRTKFSNEAVGYLTINVDVTDEGIQPPSIFIPVEQRVQLVMRNRGSNEHHFRVLELRIRDLLWLAPRGNTTDTGGDEAAEHEAHHQTGFVPFRATSPAGMRPMGDEVHAYAEAGGIDVVLFTATDTGTFLVHDPLHPEIIGKVIVYSMARDDAPVSPTSETVLTEDPSQVSLKSAAIIRELLPLLTRTALAEDGTELEALYQAPVLYQLTGRIPPELGTSSIAFTVSESVHEGVLPEGATAFVLTVDDKGPFDPLRRRRLSDDSHHRTTEYSFSGKDSDGSSLIKDGYQVLTLSGSSNDPMGTATVTTLVWHLPISPSLPSSVLTTVSLTDAQVIRVDADDKGFNPNRLKLAKGKRVVLLFQNVGSLEHHLHALEMPVQRVLWFSPPQTGSPVPSDINTLRSAQFLPYHICDSESGICPTGLDVHLHAPAGDWLAISFIPSTAGTFSMTCPLHPYMNGTVVVK